MPAATRQADLRMGLVGLSAWAGGLLVVAPGWTLVLGGILVTVGGVGAAVVAVRSRGPGRALALAWRTTALACLLALVAVLCAGLLRADRVQGDPVSAPAAEGAAVTGRLVVSTDPRPMAGARTDGVFLRAVVVEITGRGTAWKVRSPVLVLAPASWADVRLGSTVALAGRLQPTEDGERALAAVLSVHGEPTLLETPGAWWRATEVLRASLRDAVAHRPAPERVLVPALVAGDDAGLDPEVAEEFRATGLTHLLAVSGTNLTLLLGALLVLARLVGVRGRGLLVLGMAGVVGFVLLARTEPSVLRAAVMGVVGLLALTHGGGRAVRGLGVAVTVLLLVDPTLATAPGFALSVLATGGIVLIGPRWRDALARWLPRWLAEAIAVPTAAQLACTPVVAALSGQVSLVAVVANLLAAPAVGPATVLGLLGGCVGLVWPWAGRLLGTVATWCVGWIVEVAQRGADLAPPAHDRGLGMALGLQRRGQVLGCLQPGRGESRPADGRVRTVHAPAYDAVVLLAEPGRRAREAHQRPSLGPGVVGVGRGSSRRRRVRRGTGPAPGRPGGAGCRWRGRATRGRGGRAAGRARSGRRRASSVVPAWRPDGCCCDWPRARRGRGSRGSAGCASAADRP